MSEIEGHWEERAPRDGGPWRGPMRVEWVRRIAGLPPQKEERAAEVEVRRRNEEDDGDPD
jgi:hypothetical protein